MPSESGRPATSRARGTIFGLAVLALVAASCGGGSAGGDQVGSVAPDGDTVEPTDTVVGDPTTETGSAGTAGSAGSAGTVTGAETAIGVVLTGLGGLSVYAFDNDTDGVSNCNEPCSSTWIPVVSPSDLAPRLPENRVSVITRDDGSDQVALDGAPLYTHVEDTARGDINGHGVGNVWFAVSATGDVITPPSVRIGSTDSGDVLIAETGFTVYTFANDEVDTSNCLDPCDLTWPPVTADVRIDPTLDPDQFGQISRPDDTTQLTLDGLPLYTFTDDANPGDTNGIAVGTPGTWSVISESEVDELPDEAAELESSIQVAETAIGAVLTDAAGLTLYGFLHDSPTESVCNDDCVTTWIPLIEVAVDTTVISAEISTIARIDGSPQMVIGLFPAYTFVSDVAPGDVLGQGSGGIWFAIAPDGSLIR